MNTLSYDLHSASSLKQSTGIHVALLTVTQCMGGCFLTPNEQFSSYTLRMSVLYYRPTRLVMIFMVLARWNYSSQVNMSLHSNTLFFFFFQLQE